MQRNLVRSFIILGAAILICLALIYAVIRGVPLLAASSASTVASSTSASAPSAAQNDKSIQFLVALAAAAIIAIVGVLYTPFKVRLAEAVNDVAAVMGTPVCRVFVFGPEGSGKTTLIRRIVALRQRSEERSTVGFFTHSMVAPMDLKLKPSDRPRSIKVQFADYRGQDPAVVLSHPPVGFFGLEGARRVSVILLLADFFPRFTREDSPVELSNDEVVRDHADDAREILRSRIEEATTYLSKPMLNLVFAAAGSRRELLAVRLVLNKMDLLEDLLEGSLLGTVRGDAHSYALKSYKDVIDNIKDACSKLKITDRFEVVQVSGRTRAGVDELMTDILDLYDRSTSKASQNEEV